MTWFYNLSPTDCTDLIILSSDKRSDVVSVTIRLSDFLRSKRAHQKKEKKKSVLSVPSVGDKTSERNKSNKQKYARKNLSPLWHKIHLPSQRRHHQMPMRLCATNPRSTPIYRRELHRLPLCKLPSRDIKQQTLAKILSKQTSTVNRQQTSPDGDCRP